MTKQEGLRLNLGSGQHPIPGYLNVDIAGEPDLKLDLESLPWPWENDSVSEVVLRHVLEHLGQQTSLFLDIIKELYRVCQDNALVQIVVPHPRHDHYLADPTHVRPIDANTMALFSKANNQAWKENRISNSPLGFYLNVDFEIMKVNYNLDEVWKTQFESGQINQEAVFEALSRYNNVATSIDIQLRVRK
jgi:hypothetical protein